SGMGGRDGSRRKDDRGPRKPEWKPDKGADRRRYDDNRRPGADRHEQHEREELHSDNPLAVRRNEKALRMLIGRKPQLPPAEGGVNMRPRRGWKRPGTDKDSKSE
ncbi:MAG: hypothetical protein NC043_09535, partial [Muribaculaceae bacterium]|nr:hypothetical protein [Muribaculaceae bacterium]